MACLRERKLRLIKKAKYQGQNNVLAFLVDKGGRTPELDTAQQKLGLVSCKLSQDAPIYWRVREGLLGEHRVQGFFGYADWRLISPGGTDFITWHRSIFNMDIEQGIVQPTYLILEPTPAKVGIYLNGMLIGRSWYNNTSQTRFWLPEGVLKKQGENELLIAQWTRGSAPRLGQTRLESGVIRKWHKDVFRAK